MLARLQQFTTLGGLLVALLWGWGCVEAGHPGWGVAGAAFIVGGYAVVLGLEFTLLRLAHGDDPTPRATPAQLLRAWWGEVRTAPRVFCWRQPFRSRRWPDHLPPEGQGRRGLLLVHGFICNRGIWNRWLQRLHARGVPFVAVNLEPIFGSVDDYVATVEQGVLQLERCTGVPPVIVAHSMGGLAVRRWLVEAGQAGDARIRHVVTIGTPHRGTWLARWARGRNTREMRLDSPWQRLLGTREPVQRQSRFTCFYSHCDNIVFPPAVATLPGADNRHLPGVAHVAMVDHPAPWAEVQARLAEPIRP
ncbi:MAG TPA: alpha/beta fold hydrolase [Rubrivivax sp.]|nr:alpha/beta fold hydrolase [Rubrivivax sp.]